MPFKSDTKEEFIEKAQKIHGNKYEYSKVIYIKDKNDVEIICPIHGSFWQTPAGHKSGNNCPDCASIDRYEKTRYSKEELIQKLNELHNYKFTYILDNYKNTNQIINIICPDHGSFPQRVDSHLSGAQCSQCSLDSKFKSSEEWIEIFNTVHNNLYQYSEFYKNGKVDILCKKHGLFTQTTNAHRNGSRCPKCVSIISKPEIQIQEFLKELGYNIQTNKRGIIGRKELDIYIPSLKKAIEFNGKYWHYSQKHFIAGKHAHKSNLCKEVGIKLLHVREDLWIKDSEKMKEIILIFIKQKGGN